MKTRLDVWLSEHDLAPSRQRAQALIMAGVVFVNDELAKSAAQPVKEGDRVVVRQKDHPYVSRGGLKLAHALEVFNVPVQNKVAVDVGASTGGFTDCLLQAGARKIYAVDVGYGQLDWKLRQDQRVVSIERCNARYWDAAEVEETVAILTMDISFISIQKVLPSVLSALAGKMEQPFFLILLIKPQFEAGREEVGPGGVVRDNAVQQQVVTKIRRFVAELGFECVGVEAAPIKGPKGNQEYLLVAKSFDV